MLASIHSLLSCIAKWQAHLGGFVESPSPPLVASKTSEDDDDSNDDDDDEDRDSSSSSTDKMST